MKNFWNEFMKAVVDIKDVVAGRVEMPGKGYLNKEILIIEDGKIIYQDDNIKEIKYNNAYGSQKIFGMILFNDCTWLERHEYDGAEWWEYHRPPSKKNILKGIF